MEPLTPLDTLCRIVLRAREYEAQTASDYDPGEDSSNIDDEGEGTLSVLEDSVNTSVEEELTAVFEDLGEDQLAEVVAFCWVGQGTYDASDWDEASEEAQALDVIHVQVRQQDVEPAWLLVGIAHAAHPGARVEHHDRAVAALDLGARGIAAVAHRVRTGAGDRAARAPQADPHPSIRLTIPPG